MFDLGWSELLVIGIVALIVVGPKDLPVMFRRLGEFTGKARRMAREFQTAMNDAARESGVDDVAGDLRKIADPKKFGTDAFKDATRDLTSWRPDDAATSGGGDPFRAAKSSVAASDPAKGPVPDPASPAPPRAAEPSDPPEPSSRTA